MLDDKFYSVRMRASKDGAHEHGGKHISGGELLSPYSGLQQAVNALLEKGLTHSRGKPEFMQIQFELLNEQIKRLQPLTVQTNEVESAEIGRVLACRLLEKSGVPKKIIDKALEQMADCSGIRGAILIDSHSGKRIDKRSAKGVRVSRMDWVDNDFNNWANHYQLPQHSRLKEALALATKVSEHPATIAELCWSDDPDYITGYVASRKIGYQRITKLKEYGDEHGCRIFFVDTFHDVNSYINYLEKQPIFIEWEEENDTRID
ncbi:6-carboxyhexanoate--CoA ligase [uncultured Metabacillus sp.]|uniref:6-carboxyhexanoate--CoA ligase n=1 Tax=Metabacillus sp. Hm71 TaxID=3450743 RepID=UPI002603E123|nr:6-carboxyhexanoate--CoA ligase [uncultured Metabacillus sp.]